MSRVPSIQFSTATRLVLAGAFGLGALAFGLGLSNGAQAGLAICLGGAGLFAAGVAGYQRKSSG